MTDLGDGIFGVIGVFLVLLGEIKKELVALNGWAARSDAMALENRDKRMVA